MHTTISSHILYITGYKTLWDRNEQSLKLDKQYKKDANEAKIYIDGIKARQTTRRTLTPSCVLNVCIIHAHEHDVTYVNGIVTQMYDRQPCAGYIKRLTRVPWFHSSRLWLTWATRIETWRADRWSRGVIWKCHRTVNKRNMRGFNYYYENPTSFDNIWT